MSAQQNRDLVQRFYKHMSDLEFDQMFALMADDGTWTVAGKHELFHHAGTLSKAQRAEGFRHFMDFFKDMEIEVKSTTAEDDRVCVEFLTTCYTNKGLTYQNEMLVLVRCRAGKIASIYEHLDQSATLAFERKLAETSQPA